VKEILCDGPLDGLEIESSGNTHQIGQHTYRRYPDGRLYLEGSRWDKTGGMPLSP
jgi:hypothetical protein